jgi:hypothetical protein
MKEKANGVVAGEHSGVIVDILENMDEYQTQKSIAY